MSDDLRKLLDEMIAKRRAANVQPTPEPVLEVVTPVATDIVDKPRQSPLMAVVPDVEPEPEPVPVTPEPEPVAVEPEPEPAPKSDLPLEKEDLSDTEYAEKLVEALPAPAPMIAKKAPRRQAPSGLSTRERLRKIIASLSATHKEREGLVRTVAVAAVARQHLLMLSKPGTGKSHLVDDFVRHIDGANLFKIQLDEGTVPDEVLGDPNVKALVEDGQMRRNTANKLPEADVAFVDEFFNANTPTLHALMPILNERIFANGDAEPGPVPLRFSFAATNKLTDDPDLAAVLDRMHHRVFVDYVKSETLLQELITESIKRRVTGWAEPVATVTLAELDAAFEEAMNLPVADTTWQTFMECRKALQREGIEISTRREVEVMVAAHAAAWIAGHFQVEVKDLAVMVDMCWRTSDEIDTVHRVIHALVDPASGQVTEILVDLATLAEEYEATKADGNLDDMKKEAAAVRIFNKTRQSLQKIPADFDPRFDTSIRAGIDLMNRIAAEQWGMSQQEKVVNSIPAHLHRLAAVKV